MFKKAFNAFGSLKNMGKLTMEIAQLQKNIKNKFNELQKELEVNDKGDIIINKENEKEVLEKVSKFVKSAINEVDKLTSLDFNSKALAKRDIKKKLAKEFSKKIDYFKGKKPKEIYKLLKLNEV